MTTLRPYGPSLAMTKSMKETEGLQTKDKKYCKNKPLIYHKRVNFEFDPEKSQANNKKHGIDFIKAQDLWKGPFVEFAAKSEYENRFALIGTLEGKFYTCIFTLREKSLRIISCRRSQKNEVNLYEKSIKKAK